MSDNGFWYTTCIKDQLELSPLLGSMDHQILINLKHDDIGDLGPRKNLHIAEDLNRNINTIERVFETAIMCNGVLLPYLATKYIGYFSDHNYQHFIKFYEALRTFIMI